MVKLCIHILYVGANDVLRQDWKAKDLVPQNSPVCIETKQNKHSKMQQVSVCEVCLKQIKRGSKIDFFDDFGEIPQCIKQLKSYYEYRKLSIGNLWCNNYKPRGYTYLHSTGMMNVCRNSDKNLHGMIGMLQEGEDPELQVSHSEAKKAMRWLKQNNELYKEFYGNLETMHGYMRTEKADGLFTGMPTRTDDLSISDDGPVAASVTNQQAGLLFPADISDVPKKPVDVSQIEIGKQISRKSEKGNKQIEGSTDPSAPKVGSYDTLTYGDKTLESNVFPHLFPHGHSSWYHKGRKSGLSIGAYHKLRLQHVDCRWTNNRYWPFFAFDKNVKSRIGFVNNNLATNKNRKKTLNANDIKNQGYYYSYRTYFPTNVTGSKSFWTKQWLDLTARVSTWGPSEVFFTLTMNEGWSELKDILSQYPDLAFILHPAEATTYFMERWNAIKSLIIARLSGGF